MYPYQLRFGTCRLISVEVLGCLCNFFKYLVILSETLEFIFDFRKRLLLSTYNADENQYKVFKFQDYIL